MPVTRWSCRRSSPIHELPAAGRSGSVRRNSGMSGGARVAMRLALNFDVITGRAGPGVAGVFASSAGFPSNSFRESVPFPIFGTAGTDDFNHHEMRQLVRQRESHAVGGLIPVQNDQRWQSRRAESYAVDGRAPKR